MQRYNVSRTHAGAALEVTFDPAALEFVVQIVGAPQVKHCPALGLAKADLMGDLTSIALPNYQFGLPLTREDGRRLELAGCGTGTTS